MSKLRTPKDMVVDLGQALRCLSIKKASKVLEEIRGAIKNNNQPLSFLGEHGANALIYFGLASDFDNKYLSVVKDIVADFEKTPAKSLKLFDLACVGVSKGLIEFYEENYDESVKSLDSAKRDVARTEDIELNLITEYYLARCHWKISDYKNAVLFVNKAREHEKAILRSGQVSNRMALIDLLEGYLLLLKGNYDEASHFLKQARAILTQTEDHINLGNLISFEGQRLRRMGRYNEAAELFRDATNIYESGHKYESGYYHRNRARCLANLAAALRLQALKIEETKVKTREERQKNKEEVEGLRLQVFECLEEAKRIYAKDSEYRLYGRGKCHYIRALYYLDLDDFDNAEAEAENAYRLGKAKHRHNNLLMARAKITQLIIKLEREAALDYAATAQEMADEAVKLAQLSRNRRVQARAYIWKGRAMLRPPIKSKDGALDCLAKAESYLVDQEKDYLREDLNALRNEIGSFEGASNIIFSVDAKVIGELSLDQIVRKCKKSVVEFVYNIHDSYDGTAKVLQTTDKTIRRNLPERRINKVKIAKT